MYVQKRLQNHTHTSIQKFHSSEYQMENVIKFKVIYSNSSPPRHQVS